MTILKKLKRKKKLLALYSEVEKNWESWHVMDQRGVLDRFTLEVYDKLESEDEIKPGPALTAYAAVYAEYNAAMDEYKKYEQWYASDISHKNKENGRVLHDKKQAVSKKFQDMLPPVEEAKKEFKAYLIKEGVIKE